MKLEEARLLKTGDRVFVCCSGEVFSGSFITLNEPLPTCKVFRDGELPGSESWHYIESVFRSELEALELTEYYLGKSIIPSNTRIAEAANQTLRKNQLAIKNVKNRIDKIRRSKRLTKNEAERREWITKVLAVMAQVPEGFYNKEAHRLSVSLTKILESWEKRRLDFE